MKIAGSIVTFALLHVVLALSDDGQGQLISKDGTSMPKHGHSCHHKEICRHGDSPYFVVPHVEHEAADKACYKHGGRLVEVDSQNFLEVTSVAFRCGGRNSEAWVGSWNGDDYRTKCLVLHTGTAAPGGSINVPRDCHRPRSALCQKNYYCECEHEQKGDCREHKHQKPCHEHKDKNCGCGCNCNCQNVFYRFTGDRLPSIGPSGEFTYLISGNYSSNDGRLSIDNGKLVVNSNPFTSTQTNVLDHPKYLIYTNQQFAIPETGELSFSAVIGGACFGVEAQPFGAQVADPESDMRLATLAFNVIDFPNSFIFDFLITNRKIYALYERLDFSRGTLGNYAAYTFSIPVADNMPGQSHRYSINFNADEKSVRWLVDGREVYKVYGAGSLLSRQFMSLDLGGQQEIDFPKTLQVGFGTFSLLDAYPPCNVQVPTANGGFICQFPVNEEGLVQLAPTGAQKNPRNGIQNATYFENGTDPRYRLWGQGCILSVDEVTVGYCKQPRIH